MLITLVTHFFPPETGAPQVRLSDFARIWAEAGHGVTVLTGMPNHPTGIVPDEYRRALVIQETRDGYDIVRTWLYATPNEGIARKTLNHVSLMVTASVLGAARIGKTDVVVVSSPTFFSLFGAWWISRLKRAKLVVEIRDLWPALIVELGVLTNSTITRILEHAELWMYRQADAVVVVTEGFKENLISRGVPAPKITTITNGVDLSEFSISTELDYTLRENLGGTNGKTLALYLGTHGLSQGLGSVIAAAHLVRDQPIHFAFVGEGADKLALEAMVEELKLANVSFFPAVPRQQVPSVIAASDVFLVPLKDEPILSKFIPSKIFEAMALGTPIIGAVRGQAEQILRNAGARVVAPESPSQLAEALVEFINAPQDRREYALKARALVESEFDRRVLAIRYLELLQRVKDGSI